MCIWYDSFGKNDIMKLSMFHCIMTNATIETRSIWISFAFQAQLDSKHASIFYETFWIKVKRDNFLWLSISFDQIQGDK